MLTIYMVISMKETGVIRRIDELGRIVIPKEVRKKLKIRNGDSIDIYIDNDKILLQKYSALKDLEEIVKVLVETLSKSYNASIVISDMSKVLATSIKEVNIETSLSEDFTKIIEQQNTLDITKNNLLLNDTYIIPIHSKLKPIIIYGDLYGSILITNCNNKSEELITILNNFITQYLES